MSRRFHWQPSEAGEMDVADLMVFFREAKAYLEAEAEARK